MVVFACNHCPYVIHVRDAFGRLAREFQGKGVSFVEADWTYHGKPLTPAERDRAHAELGVG